MGSWLEAEGASESSAWVCECDGYSLAECEGTQTEVDIISKQCASCPQAAGEQYIPLVHTVDRALHRHQQMT
jgi:hypothetical protein